MIGKRKQQFLSENALLMAEWHPSKNGDINPANVALHSNKRFWWICSQCGHEWQTSANHRTSEGTGCPECANKVRAVKRTKAAAQKNNLVTHYPHLVAEWNYELNGNLSPEDISVSSHKKVWWKCSAGHNWQALVSLRLRSGCPYCSGRYAITGVNDLATTNPQLAAEWDWEKNGDLTPYNTKEFSSKRAWWLCALGHSYEAIISNRRNKGCPYCANRKVLPGYNDICTTHPEMANEWHPTKNENITPDTVSFGMTQKYWWKCSICGGEWKTSPNSKQGCPHCSKRNTTSFPEQAIFFYVQQVYCDAVSRHKIFGGEMDIYIPSIQTAIEYDGVYFHKKESTFLRDNAKDDLCQKHHIRLIRFRDPSLKDTKNAERITCRDVYHTTELDDAIRTLFSMLPEGQAPAISIRNDFATIVGRYHKYVRDNSLAEKNPALAKEWHTEKNAPLDPWHVTPGSNIKVWWICKNGHEWQATIGSRKQCGCPYCSGRKKTIAENLSIELEPDSAAAIAQKTSTLSDAFSDSDNRTTWRTCPQCGVVWQTATNARHSTLCSTCAHIKVGRKIKERAVVQNNLQEKFPTVAAQWNYKRNAPRTPKEYSAGSGEKVWWICEKGHEWESSIGNRTSQKLGCPYCGNQKLLSGFNDFATANPDKAKEWHPTKNGDLLPTGFLAGSTYKAWWLCSICGREWKTEMRLRNKGSGCPSCSKKIPKPRSKTHLND